MRAFAAAAALLGAASASPAGISDYIRAATNTPAHNTTSTSEEPCALISEALRNQTAKHTVPLDAKVAYACLQSVPLHTKDAALQLEGVRTFTQFQSTLAYLKTPTEGYLYPAVDVFGAYDQIAKKLENNEYKGEYDFQFDLLDTINSAHDGHFWYFADITQIFSFVRQPLYSVSKDGISVPEVYLAADIIAFNSPNGTNSTTSPVARINGQDVEAFLNQNAAATGNNQDPDANYNTMFPEYVRGAKSVGVFASSSFYSGPVTTLTFRNGTSRIMQNYATTTANFTGVVDGKSFFEQFCVPQTSSEEDATPTPSSTEAPVIPTTEVPFKAVPTQTANPGPDGYPVPVIINDDGSVAGYHPRYNKELAVLSIPTFQPADDTQFENVVRQFLAMSQAAGKKKLVIDLRGNGGGDVDLAYDLFSQLFPKSIPYGATNFRATPLGNDVGIIVSDFYSNVTNATISPDECNNPTDFSIHPFNYREQLNVDNGNFTSWQDFFGPHEYHGDNFTSLTRYNLNDKYTFSCSNISGFGNITNITPVQVFQQENIILVQDGICASTCAVFSEFVKSQKSIKQVVFGGRAQTGPQQAVGGVKGANVYGWDLLAMAIDEAGVDDATPAQAAYFQKTYGNLTAPAQQALARAAVIENEVQAKVNIRNNIRQGDASVTPLQFVYEAADCRRFYTPAMLADQSLIWKAAYDSIWGNASCVAGSTGHPSSKPGVIAPGQNVPPESARNFFGADVSGPYPVANSSLKASSTGNGNGNGTATEPQAYTGGAMGASVSGLMVTLMAFVAACMLV
ncbi:hypothetical protein M409DRAFT_57214 [Zasmidium cellare ATCC 36951]|uniref:Uncharacterized protein n=1 Tax=Zasmidium cellare ATCC 36951 TaxID=1080233 RepID=A0A6A6CDF2_ZASCE|nr:uncharacterized protein M409DRAFT_57214 [Zasmidium cellare ATCC 36951]KAF2163719.1 hypothetical protein M409DRAFT_57214 [Zasmidium cellare ATCC 36951]